jgi:hypothetical protein
MSDVAFCVHGHFYQPPRENPISGEIPNERGSFPFKNWNELIFSHCYKPNAELGNFKNISFNMGPTLIDWMEKNYPQTVEDIVNQHKNNYEKFGVGNALAQPYHHVILPLASYEDKVTQIKWGIADYKNLFGNNPTGMWLPETAVDMETLIIMEANGIEFTILAPWQADTNELDVTRPYWVELPNDRKIAVFFYHQEMSTLISFNPSSTINADHFVAEKLMPNFVNQGKADSSKILMVATDGELYGHHQPFRDKFLAQLMNGALSARNIKYTFPALWLRENPPNTSIKIRNNTSWSCHHGIERWGKGCECTPLSEWKGSLRAAFDVVAGVIDKETIRFFNSKVNNVWELRNRYFDVVSGNINERDFFDKELGTTLTDNEFRNCSLLLNAQLNRLKMYTSCGWFFENLDRIEPYNAIFYAVKALISIELVSDKKYVDQVFPYFESINQIGSKTSGSEIFLKLYAETQKSDFNLQ